MDWEKWRKKEDERQLDIAQLQDLRKLLGLENRSPLRFWFDMVTTGTLLLVSIPLMIVGLPWVIDQYRSDPTLWPTACKHLKDLIVPAILAIVINIALVLLFSRNK